MSEDIWKICEDCGSESFAVYYAAEVSEFDNDGRLYCVDCCAFWEGDEE